MVLRLKRNLRPDKWWIKIEIQGCRKEVAGSSWLKTVLSWPLDWWLKYKDERCSEGSLRLCVFVQVLLFVSKSHFAFLIGYFYSAFLHVPKSTTTTSFPFNTFKPCCVWIINPLGLVDFLVVKSSLLLWGKCRCWRRLRRNFWRQNLDTIK